MNLIEQLGGYQAAKNLLSGISNNKSPHEILTRELLEYRCQHNIFDVGDLVVYLSNIAPEHNDLYEVWKVDLTGCIIVLNDMDYRATYGQIKHATPSEIKAGKRLEVK